MPIADARLLPDAASVVVSGVVTVAIGSLESGRAGFVQDASAGISVYLDAAQATPIPAGTRVLVAGTIDERYAQRTLRVARAAIQTLGDADLPVAAAVRTGDATEALEGSRIAVSGTVAGTGSPLADGLAITIDDGSGALRLVVAPPALPGPPPSAGDLLFALGTLGQRDSTGTGISGYRLHVTLPDELLVVPAPSPTPQPTPTPTPTASPTPSPSPSPSASPTPSPTASPSATPSPSIPVAAFGVSEARQRAVGGRMTVRGVVVAEPGRLGTPPIFVIADSQAGLAIRLADGQSAPPRGTLVIVSGQLADPYGQLELRLASDGMRSDGAGTLPQPLPISGSSLGEALEGRLVTVEGVADGAPQRATSGDFTITLRTSQGDQVRVYADASAEVDATSFGPGGTYRVTGIVGQRASRKGALDGYRIWIRDGDDLVQLAAAVASASPSPSKAPASAPSSSKRSGAAGASRSPAPVAVATAPIAEALLARDGSVTVEGVVTAGTTLLDTSGRRLVVEDATAAVEVYLAGPDPRLVPGRRLRVTGTMARAYGAPRLKAGEVEILGTASVAPRALTVAPGTAHEWRLVRVSGLVVDVARSGARWRAELELRGERLVVSGLAGAGIASTALVEGRSATIVGIVRRPNPSASDRRFAIVPRSPSDIVLGPPARPARARDRTQAPGTAAARTGSTAPSRDTSADDGQPGASPQAAGTPSPVDIDLAALETQLGKRVRVGGLVVDLLDDGISLDDGTSIATVRLVGDAAVHLPLLEPGDAVNAVGIPAREGDGSVVVVTEGAGLVRVPALGERVELESDPMVAVPWDEGEVEESPAGPRAAGLEELGGLPGPGAGLGSLALVGLASIAIHALRQTRTRRVAEARARARLARIFDAPGAELIGTHADVRRAELATLEASGSSRTNAPG